MGWKYLTYKLFEEPNIDLGFVWYNNYESLVDQNKNCECEAQIFYSFEAAYNALYEASQMICFDSAVLENKTFENPHTRPHTRPNN